MHKITDNVINYYLVLSFCSIFSVFFAGRTCNEHVSENCWYAVQRLFLVEKNYLHNVNVVAAIRFGIMVVFLYEFCSIFCESSRNWLHLIWFIFYTHIHADVCRCVSMCNLYRFEWHCMCECISSIVEMHREFWMVSKSSIRNLNSYYYCWRSGKYFWSD